jgi:hypothetical protein
MAFLRKPFLEEPDVQMSDHISSLNLNNPAFDI